MSASTANIKELVVIDRQIKDWEILANNISKEGDWVLETAVGGIESALPFSTDTVDGYTGILTTAGQTELFASAPGSIKIAYNKEQFRITLFAGKKYTIDVEGSPTQKGTLSDPYFYGISDSSFQSLGYEDDDSGIGANAEVDFIPATTGLYYLAAGGYGSNIGTYTLSVSISTPNSAPSFATGNGTVITSIGSYADFGYSGTIQTDGKIIVVGSSGKSSIDSKYDFAIARYNSDGILDASFGKNGIVTTPVGSTNDYEQDAQSVKVQSDGKIIVVGKHSNYGGIHSIYYFDLVRYNPNGSLDTTFGTSGNGKVIVPTNYGGAGYEVAIQSDGKILAAGYISNGYDGDFGLVRYNENGTLDTTFNNSGVVITPINPSSGDDGRSLAIQTDGKIIVAGTTNSSNGNEVALVRYNANGNLDTSFGINNTGKAITNFTYGVHGESVAIQNNGKILVSGYGEDINGSFFLLVRFTSSGALDTTFNQTGVVTTKIGYNDESSSVILQADGKILVAGFSHPFNSNVTQFALVRYTSGGISDTSFGSNGIVTTGFGHSDERGYSVNIQSDGRIVVSGYSGNGGNATDFALARYNSDGSLDNTFGSKINTLNNSPVYIENGAVVVLDNTVQIADSELATQGNYNGASITLMRHGSANGQDQFSASGNLFFINGNAIFSGVTIGSVTNGNGILLLTFNDKATQPIVNATLSSLAYSNYSDAPPSSVQIDWIFADGNTGAQGTGGALSAIGSTTVNIAPVNDAPIFTSFSAPIINGNEDNQMPISFAQLQAQGNESDVDGMVTAFIVKTVSTGSLRIGTDVLNSTAWNAISNNTIDTSHNAYWTPDPNANGIVNIFTVTAKDNGGLESPTAIQATVNVVPVNDAPVLNTPAAMSFTDTIFDDTFATVNGTLLASDIDSNLLTFGILGGSDNGSGTISLTVLYGTLTISKSTGTYSFVVDDAAIEALTAPTNTSFTVTVSDGLLSDSKTLSVNISQAGATESNGNDTLTGTTGNDKFDALGGNDIINGLTGADTMIGGLGNDIYYVDNSGDAVIEKSTVTTETDTIISSISYSLPNNTEFLILSGNSAINGTGNTLKNTLVGNAAANSLDGMIGNDTLNGVGGNDILIGGLGKDKLTGGTGADIFKFVTIFETAANTNRDTITDFSSFQGDKIDLSLIDADTSTAKDDSFSTPIGIGTFIGSFTNSASLFFDSGSHILYGNNDTDSTADFSILLSGVAALAISDIII